MPYWLVKTEPDAYAYGELEQAGRDVWDGVKNNLALKHMRNMQPGDLVFVYHTGRGKSVVGVAEVTSPPYSDPGSGSEKDTVIDLAARYRLTRPVTLREIKADPALAGWDLVRNSRLSIMPVTDAQWVWVHRAGQTESRL
jgi:predicted RNA-binding protein with PUA-like domain